VREPESLEKGGEKMVVHAKPGDIVRVHYTGRFEDGTVFDSSLDREPIEFTIGEGQIIPGFEEALIGMTSGESKTVMIPPEKAYGPYRKEMVVVISRDHFPEGLELNVGEKLQLTQADGTPVIVTITEVTDATVTLDANHPLAGKNLIFDIKLVDII